MCIGYAWGMVWGAKQLAVWLASFAWSCSLLAAPHHAVDSWMESPMHSSDETLCSSMGWGISWLRAQHNALRTAWVSPRNCLKCLRLPRAGQAFTVLLLLAASIIFLNIFKVQQNMAPAGPSLSSAVHLPLLHSHLASGTFTGYGCDSGIPDATRVLPDEVLIPAHCPPLPRTAHAHLFAKGYDEAQLDALRPIATAASLRSGYRYEFVRRYENLAPASRLIREDRLMCVNQATGWTIYVTGGRQSMPRDVDAAAIDELGFPLVGAGRLHDVWERIGGRLNATEAVVRRAAELLRGQLAHTPQPYWTGAAWSPSSASNLHWRDVLGMNDLVPCGGTPAEEPRCLRRYIKLAAEQLGGAGGGSSWLRGPRGGGSPHPGQPALGQGGSMVFGRDAGGNVHAWTAACAACLWEGVPDGLFLMWQPGWLLPEPVAVNSEGQSVRSLYSRPTALLSHWNCTMRSSAQHTAQCALPVWHTHGTPAGGMGDTRHSTGVRAVEMLNRTAYINTPLWAFHYTHRLFNYLVPNAVLLHNLGGDPSRDMLGVHGGGDEEVDVSMLVDAPQLRHAGVLPDAAEGGVPVARSCFARSVLGAGFVCPAHECGHMVPEGITGAIAARVRERLHVGQPPRVRSPPHTVYVVQREAGTRSLLNAAQIVDVLNAFAGLRVTELKLEGSDAAQQVRIFSNASMVVASHGNALGNMLWMPRGAAVMEYLGEGFQTAFFSGPGSQRDMVWLQGHCRASALGKALDAGFVAPLLAQLSARPKLAWMVGAETQAALLRVQGRVQAETYRIPAGALLANGSKDATINAHAGGGGRATCLFESAVVSKGGADSKLKDRHVYVPVSQFLEDFVKVALQWEAYL